MQDAGCGIQDAGCGMHDGLGFFEFVFEVAGHFAEEFFAEFDFGVADGDLGVAGVDSGWAGAELVG